MCCWRVKEEKTETQDLNWELRNWGLGQCFTVRLPLLLYSSLLLDNGLGLSKRLIWPSSHYLTHWVTLTHRHTHIKIQTVSDVCVCVCAHAQFHAQSLPHSHFAYTRPPVCLDLSGHRLHSSVFTHVSFSTHVCSLGTVETALPCKCLLSLTPQVAKSPHLNESLQNGKHKLGSQCRVQSDVCLGWILIELLNIQPKFNTHTDKHTPTY